MNTAHQNPAYSNARVYQSTCSSFTHQSYPAKYTQETSASEPIEPVTSPTLSPHFRPKILPMPNLLFRSSSPLN